MKITDQQYTEARAVIQAYEQQRKELSKTKEDAWCREYLDWLRSEIPHLDKYAAMRFDDGENFNTTLRLPQPRLSVDICGRIWKQPYRDEVQQLTTILDNAFPNDWTDHEGPRFGEQR